MSWTPGPWEVEVTENTIETSVCGPIKMRYRRTLNVSDEERRANMAAMEAEAMANAHLIAAAPDLLEACEAVMRWWQKWPEFVLHREHPDGPQAGFAKMKAAIAKAKGEQ